MCPYPPPRTRCPALVPAPSLPTAPPPAAPRPHTPVPAAPHPYLRPRTSGPVPARRPRASPPAASPLRRPCALPPARICTCPAPVPAPPAPPVPTCPAAPFPSRPRSRRPTRRRPTVPARTCRPACTRTHTYPRPHSRRVIARRVAARPHLYPPRTRGPIPAAALFTPRRRPPTRCPASTHTHPPPCTHPYPHTRVAATRPVPVPGRSSADVTGGSVVSGRIGHVTY
ncbi:hypothetical protein GGX14DRAFT_574052 [Mycena pura]|uniref:Uncharacterized protein n=1 Tax=Mycena pura TaxID=153505 RepID=A0AAD6V214_9AGAR|nr:hypothetical protein GGX14DRAFT_574052 [Mycena pura]